MALWGYLRKKNQKEQFIPTLYSVFFNPFYFNRKAIYNGIKKHAPALKGQLLDFGCGNKPYEHLFTVQKYTGIDLEFNEGHNNPNSKVDVFYDGNKLPFNSNSFDSIYTSEVFEHVFNLEDILAEIRRVHKPGGYLLITMPFVWPEHEMPNDFGRYTSSGIKSILARHNYDIVAHEKKPTFFISVMQMLNAYIHFSILPKSNILKLFLAPFIIFPINFLGIILGTLLPKSDSLYINHVILAKNKKTD